MDDDDNDDSQATDQGHPHHWDAIDAESDGLSLFLPNFNFDQIYRCVAYSTTCLFFCRIFALNFSLILFVENMRPFIDFFHFS